MTKTSRFAFINHCLDTQLFSKGLILSLLDRFMNIKNLVRFIPPYKFVDIRPIFSSTGAVVEGIGILCPLLPEHFVTLDPSEVLGKILRCVRIAEHYGAGIIGLGGFTSIFGNEGEEIARRTTVPITSGNTYTAVLAVSGVLRAADSIGVRLEDRTLVILGATGDIGSACARSLAAKVKHLVLVARREDRLIRLKRELESKFKCQAEISLKTSQAIRQADIIISVTSALTTIIDPELLVPGTIVCDVAYPANITRDIAKIRSDILVFEGGMCTLPDHGRLEGDAKRKLENFNPPGVIHGCLAETILLTLDQQFVPFSLGRGNITSENMTKISRLAQKHGFELAPLYCGGSFYSEEQLEFIRSALKNRVTKGTLSCSIP